MPGKFTVRVIWTQWSIGLWWWPVKKDLAMGVQFGPVHVIWTIDKEYD